jgi:hypothetical protein
VLVEGTNIPANAIVGGEDRRKPLYIARSFYEVWLFLRDIFGYGSILAVF